MQNWRKLAMCSSDVSLVYQTDYFRQTVGGQITFDNHLTPLSINETTTSQK